MKKSLFAFIFVCSMITSFQVDAQKFYIRDIFDFYNDINSDGLSAKQKQTTYSKIDGSPYLNKDFIEGTIITNDGERYDKIPLRYNAYDDRIEYMHKSGIAFYLTKPPDYKEIIINNTRFTYREFTNTTPGYYELIIEGKISLLKKKTINLREASPAKPFNDPKPAKFISKPDQLFILDNDDKLFKLKNEKVIISLLNDKKDEIASYIKKNKLKTRNTKDLIKIISYYNQND